MKMIKGTRRVFAALSMLSVSLAITHYLKEDYGFFFPVFSIVPTNPDLYGGWVDNHSYPDKGGTVHIKTITHYFKSGDYDVSGVLGVTAYKAGHALTYWYTVTGAGEWKADTHGLIVKLQDMRSSIKTIEYDAREIVPKDFEAFTGNKIPDLATAFPKGVAGEFRILNISHDTVDLMARDPQGHTFSFTMTRLSDSLVSR